MKFIIMETTMYTPRTNKKERLLYFLFVWMVLSTSAIFATPPAAALNQARNGPHTAPISPVNWQNGNVNQSQAHMLEGYSLPYQVVMTNMVVGTPVDLVLEFDTRHSSKNALDFLTGYNNLDPHDIWGHAVEIVNPVVGYSQFTLGGDSHITIVPPNNLPTKTYFNAFMASHPGLNYMSIWGATPRALTPFEYVTEQALSGAKSTTSFKVHFTPTSSTVILAWGGHISSAQDWGNGNSAGSISGSPYHTRTLSWNINNLGNQDRSMQATVVMPSYDCSFTVSQSSCGNTSLTATVDSYQSLATYAWSVTSNTSGATPATGTGQSFIVNSGNTSGAFILGLAASVNYSGTIFTKNCAKTVTVKQPVSTETHVNVLCRGNASGSIDLSVTGGTTPYAYTWTATLGGVIPTGQAHNQDLTGLIPGTYTVVATDANLCSTSRSVIITQPSSAVSATITSQTNVLCYGSATGSVTIAGSGGISPYTYALGTGSYQSGGTFSNLLAGSYTVHVKDANGCIYDKPVVITQPSTGLTTSETHINVACFGNATGSIDLTVSGGSKNISCTYTYTWTASLGGIVPTGQLHNQDLTGLVAGTYTVVVTDANQCSTSRSVIITQPTSALSTTESHINVLCRGNASGSIDLSVTGGTTPYAYNWTATLGGVIPTGQSHNQDLTGLTPGTYSVNVTDANLCSSSRSVIITQPSSAVSATITSQTNVLCNGSNTGCVTVSGSGGVSPYTYALGNGSYQSEGTFCNLSAGNYIVHVKDANGCIYDKTVVITQPLTALSATETHVNVTVTGAATGSIDLTVAGGISPYTYDWTASLGGVIPAGQSHVQDQTNLIAGTYTVVVTDVNQCRTSLSVIITQPGNTLSAHILQTNVLCYGQSTGSVTITGNGGVSPYLYALGSGPYGSNNVFGNLSSGTYNIHVKDANGSTIDQPVFISQPSSALTTTETHLNVSCPGNATGSIDLSVAGGTIPYSYEWSASLGGIIPEGQGSGEDLTGLTAGTYNVVVTDINLCSATRSVSITQPLSPPLAASETHNNITCTGNATGSIDLLVTGGTNPYTYEWTASNGGVIPTGQAHNQNLTGLVTGTYTVVVTDALHCTTSLDVIISLPSSIPGIITWSGQTGITWDDPGNWVGDIVPSATNNIYIPDGSSHYPVLASGTMIYVHDLIIGGYLNINAGAALTVEGDLTICGGLVVESGGSLITGCNVTGTATIKRRITSDLHWHLISSPVTQQNICDGAFAPLEADFGSTPAETWDFYKWLPNCPVPPIPAERWRNLRTESQGVNYTDFGTPPSFAVAKGYLVAYGTGFPKTKSFIGTPNTCDKVLDFSEIISECSWELAGNPFPSAVDWSQVTGKENLVTGYYYVWNENKAGGAGYEWWYDENHRSSIMINGNIPPMQGFFVKVAPAGGKLIGMPNSARVHDVTDGLWLKENTANKLSIALSNGTNFDEAFIMFENGSSIGQDRNDAEKLFSMSPKVPQVYTIVNGDLKAGLNSLPLVTDGATIAVGIVPPVAGNYSLTAKGMESFTSLTGLSLEDLKLNITQNLIQNPEYHFTATGNEDAGRFLLHFAGAISIDNKDISQINIYSNEKTVFITGAAKALVTVTNLLGQEIVTRKLNDQSTNQIQVNGMKGYYIVKVQNESSVKTAKVYID